MAENTLTKDYNYHLYQVSAGKANLVFLALNDKYIPIHAPHQY
jgi:hypothetical protein